MTGYFWVPVLGSGTGVWDNSLNIHWATSSGGVGGVGVPGSGDTVTFDANSCPAAEVVTVNANINVTSITMGAFTGTLDFSANNNSPTMQTFNGSGSGTRTLNMGSGNWNITGNNATVWTTATTTGLTFNGNNAVLNFTYSGAIGTRTINSGNSAVVRLPSLNVTAGSDAVSLSSSILGNVSFAGYTGALTIASSSAFGASATFGIGQTVVSGSNTLTFNAASGSPILTSNSVVVDVPISLAMTTGVTLQLADSFQMSSSSTRTFTLNTGNFDANNKNVIVGAFSSSNSNTRTLTMGNGMWALTGNATSIFTISTSTNLTLTATTAIINATYSGAIGTRIINMGSTNAFGGTVKVSAGTDTVSIQKQSGASSYGSIDFTGFTGTLGTGAGTTILFTGNLTLGTGMICGDDNTHTWTVGGTGTQTITFNGVKLGFQVSIASTAGTVILADTFSLFADNTFTFNGGVLTANSNVSVGIFNSSNSNARTLTMGSGIWTLTGTGTVWNTSTTTGLSFNADTSTIVINDSSSSSKTFAEGTLTFYNLRLTGGGTGAMIIGTTTASNTFNNIQIDPPLTVQFFAGSTTLARSYTWSGTPGNLSTLQSTTNGTSWNIGALTGAEAMDYISLRDSTVSVGAPLYAGSHSINVSNNVGWIFGADVASFSGFLAFF